MFDEDIKRIKACIYYEDYYAALQYAITRKERYKDEQREFLEEIIRVIKNGNYQEIQKIYHFSRRNYDKKTRNNKLEILDVFLNERNSKTNL